MQHLCAIPLWAWILIAWAAYLAVVAVIQNKLLFGHTRRLLRAIAGPSPVTVEPITFRRPGSVSLEGWLCLPVHKPRGLVLWFGGRNENVAWTPDLAGWLPPDMALVAFNYRSMGSSTGWPSQDACLSDAEALASHFLNRLSLRPCDLHLVGRSLGSGFAVQLASSLNCALTPPASLTLITPPKSIPALCLTSPRLATVSPLAPFLSSPLNSIQAARDLRVPALVVLAETDRRVPHKHSLQLASALRSAGSIVQIHTIAGTDHCSIARHLSAMQGIAAWIDNHRPSDQPLVAQRQKPVPA